jgi:hypothetical protein
LGEELGGHLWWLHNKVQGAEIQCRWSRTVMMDDAGVCGTTLTVAAPFPHTSAFP